MPEEKAVPKARKFAVVGAFCAVILAFVSSSMERGPFPFFYGKIENFYFQTVIFRQLWLLTGISLT